MDKFQVNCYGLHSDGTVQWLVQGRSGSNFVGLKAQCPFEPPKFACNHLIPQAAPIPDKFHWAQFLHLVDHPLVQAMMPILQPLSRRALYIETNDTWLMVTLSRLSSPIRPIVKHLRNFSVKDIPRELTASNIQPLVLMGATQKDQALISAIADSAPTLPRTVIICGDDSVGMRGSITRHTPPPTSLEDLMALPLESLGAFVLRRFARGEELFGPMESREDRRARLLYERTKST